LSEGFREQYVTTELYGQLRDLEDQGEEFGVLLAASMLKGKFFPKGVSGECGPFLRYKREEFMELVEAYEAVWGNLECFPVAAEDVFFEDSWGSTRTYGGERVHEGTDLFGTVTEPGYYPILSVTDGVVEQKGWLPLGGYRIGIRGESGGYFYYAHLSEYEDGLEVGDSVNAGDILGFMGNTGYGPEGTSGQFPVHLHFGIYIAAAGKEELSVNPYWVLKNIEKNKRKYSY
jgi:murein DD-endopeptidase MepM/ murein hydrolase activator NlpD